MKNKRFPHRSCRGRSPLMNDKRKLRVQMRPIRSSECRSVSRERYLDHSFRRSGHGKELFRNHSPQPQHRYRSISPPLMSRDEEHGLQQKYILSEHSSFNPNWRPSHSIKDRDRHTRINEFLRHSSLDVMDQDMHPPKSTIIGEGNSRRSYPDHSMGSTVLCSELPKHSVSTFGMDQDMHPQKSYIIGEGNSGRSYPYHSIGSTVLCSESSKHGISTLGMDHDMHTQKSSIIGEGNSQRSYPDHPMSSTVLCSELPKHSVSTFGTEKHDSEVHSYSDELRPPYDDMERRHIHSRNLSIPKMPSSSSEMRSFSNMPSYSLLKEEIKGFHHNNIADGIATEMGRYPNEELYARSKVPKPDPSRHDVLDDCRIFDYNEPSRRNLDDNRISMDDEPYQRQPHTSRTEFINTTSSTILNYDGEWMVRDDSPKRNLFERSFTNHYHSYDDLIAKQELQTHSGKYHGRFRDKPSLDFEDNFYFEKEFISNSFKSEHKRKRHFLSDLERSRMDDLCDYEVERMANTDYAIIEHIDENNSRIRFMDYQHSLTPYEGEEMWPTEEPLGPSLPKSLPSKHTQYRKISRGNGKSNSDVFIPSSSSLSMLEKCDYNGSLKSRLRHVNSGLYTQSISGKRQDSSKFDKSRKRGIQARLGAQGIGTRESGTHAVKNDPPEESEEFTKQVHTSFLRFSKLLNESLSSQKLYKKQGITHRLLCIVCGSNSKEFLDTNNLVTHSYHSLKAGLKTEHLGFHRAVCVLMGWNWLVPPDASREYQSLSVSEVKSMRQDLILWPPVVIVHKCLIGDNSSPIAAKAVTVETIEKMLRDKGFGTGLAGVYLGKPANQSIFTVKFSPTFSGFQTAERLHKHFTAKGHGKQEFQKISSSKKKIENQHSIQMEEILYGYIAIAEDMDKLDPKILKKILIKSRKDDVEAIANAQLKTC